MKTRLNITIEESVLNKARLYAAKKSISLSELIEVYFKNLTRPVRKKNIIQLVEELSIPKIDLSKDRKQ
jgi:Family of unknown function (DUF6364)